MITPLSLRLFHLQIESLPTLNLHQYYKRADTRSDKQTTSQTDMQLGDQADSQIETLDLCTLSSAGEQLIVFFAWWVLFL